MCFALLGGFCTSKLYSMLVTTVVYKKSSYCKSRCGLTIVARGWQAAEQQISCSQSPYRSRVEKLCLHSRPDTMLSCDHVSPI